MVYLDDDLRMDTIVNSNHVNDYTDGCFLICPKSSHSISQSHVLVLYTIW